MRMSISRTWPATTHVVVGLPVAVVTGGLVLLAAIFAGVVVLTAVGIPYALSILFAVARLSTSVQRSRFAALLGVRMAAASPSWRQVWYHMVVGFLLAVLGFSVIVTLWSAAILAVMLPVFSRPATQFFALRPAEPVTWTGLTVLGVALAFAAVKVAPALAALEVRAARAMLEPNRAKELEQRVEALTESRAEVVDAADAERRRIERDLHDGAQQRLVALAMNLGMARADLTDVDERARQAIARAHDEAKQALTELRQLVRGLHPAVLDDRGLDAALSGIAARSPVPTRLEVDVPQRPSRTIEAIAYFVVAESLSNVAKHAQATEVLVSVVRQDQSLLVTVRDDGCGGADPSGGTGLRGLSQRVSSVDGTLRVRSPIGGPTVITVELPCES